VQLDAVELLPEVIDASALFVTPPAGLRLLAADARRYVRAAGPRYDVIVSDNFHPARSGSAALYTVEHFEAVRAKLSKDGVFCQWLPLHQLDLPTLRSIVQSYMVAFPNGWAMLATNSLETPVLGLIARAEPGGFSWRGVQGRLAQYRAPQPLAAYGLGDEFALMGSFIAGPSALLRFAAAAPLNTDDRPVVAYRAPRVTYAPDSLPRDRLLALLQELTVTPAELLADPLPEPWPQRLTAYAAARNLYLAHGRQVRPAQDVHAMLAQVREPLLQVLRTSPDFAPAYEPLLHMAQALATEQPAAARDLLSELQRVAPARAEAAAALQVLSP
jgi:spermidine synthase